jgi:hypothetical protein
VTRSSEYSDELTGFGAMDSVSVFKSLNFTSHKRCIDLFKHSVGLVWTSDQPIAKASTYTGHKTQKEDKHHTLSGVRTHDLSFQAISPQTARSMEPANGQFTGPVLQILVLLTDSLTVSYGSNIFNC